MMIYKILIQKQIEILKSNKALIFMLRMKNYYKQHIKTIKN